MTPTERKNVDNVRRQVVWLNNHDIESFINALAEDFIWKSDVLPEPDVGIQGARRGLKLIYGVFPNLRFRELAIYPSGASVIGVFEISGTVINTGAGALLPPIKDRTWKLNQAVIHTFGRNGKMKMVWLFTNVANLLQQLGVLPEGITTFGHGDRQIPETEPSPPVSKLRYRQAIPRLQPTCTDELDPQWLDRWIDTFSKILLLPIRILYETLVHIEQESGSSK